jgi:hypothetical protein
LCHQGSRCPRGRYCAFAHSRDELLVPHFEEAEEANPSEEFIAFRFKTQWCPIGGPHDWENCVYAHTYRDWRRSPIIGYSSRPCPQWARSIAAGPSELAYSERCPRSMSCPLAHGSKEQLYHPHFYKTNSCSGNNCKRGPLCAFNHGPHDMRQVSEAAGSRSARDRDRLSRAEELLMLHQPTCLCPPKYHALEEPGRGNFAGVMGNAGHSGGSSTNRGRNEFTAHTHAKRAGRSKQAAWPSVQEEGVWGEHVAMDEESMANAMAADTTHGPQHQLPLDGFAQPDWYYYQWMPCTESTVAVMPSFIAVAEAYESWPMPDGCGPVVWDSTVAPFVPQSFDHWIAEAPTGDLALSPVDEELRFAAGTGGAFSPGNGGLQPPCEVNPAANNAERVQNPKGPIARQSRCYPQQGIRTPSSLGSPPLSATPTEVSSPRPVEFAASSSVDGTSAGS